ncbi:SpoIID/LytB domain-containing protein [Halanaerobaculum tunisiense]
MFKPNLCITLLVAILTILGGCTQQQKQGRMEEPVIKVKLATGNTKEMPLEEYVAGVVAGEMKRNWPKNAYAAQAIGARTFAMSRLEEKKTNVISAQHQEAQAYRPENITLAIRQAVRMTRGQVVTYQGRYIKAWFHSSAGGETTTAQAGLNYKDKEPPYIKSVKSPDESAPANIRNWEVTLQQEELLTALEKTGEKANKIIDIKLLVKDKTGRVVRLKIIHDQGSKKLHGAEFRMAIGPDKLKSTLIESVKKQRADFIFSGRGYGHGVGMSQWGAFQLAKQGATPEEIINYYFEGIKIIKRWD